MIDFGMYYDLKNHLDIINMSESEPEKHPFLEITYKEAFIRTLSKAAIKPKRFLKHGDDNSAFLSLIEQCDKQTLLDLIEWFDKEAPIQKLLQKRLSEIDKFPFQRNDKETQREQNTFFINLCELIDRKGYNSDADFYNYAGISRQSFSKLRNQSSNVSREMAIHIAVALELDYSTANSLLNIAGYSLKSTSRREAIISYVMRNKKYTFQEMNEILFLFGEKTFLEY